MLHDRAARLARHAALTLLLLPLWSCASPRLGDGESVYAAKPRGALLTVENRHVQDMRIYLIRGYTPIALGSVGTLERRTFTLPTSLLGHVGTIQLMADPLGSRRRYTSEPIHAAPGDHVRWTLAPSLALSSFSVRRIVGA